MLITRIFVILGWIAVTLFLGSAVSGYMEPMEHGYFKYPEWRAEFLKWAGCAVLSLFVVLSAAVLRGRSLAFVMLPASLALGVGSLALALVALLMPHGPGGPLVAVLIFVPGVGLAALTAWLGIANSRGSKHVS